MKIAFLMHSPFTIGGVQKITTLLANALQDKGYEIDIIMLGDTSINYDLYGMEKDINIIKISNVAIFSLLNKIRKRLNKYFGIYKNNVKKMKEFMYDDVVLENVKNTINHNKYDIVIATEAYYSVLLGLLKDKLKCKTIAWQHNNFNTYFRNKYNYFWNLDELFKYAVKKLDCCVVLTNYDVKKFKEELKIDSICINNFISFERFDENIMENTQNISKEEKVFKFITIGRFSYNKGYDLLLKSFKIFNDTNKQWKMCIIGSGNSKKEIKYINKNKLNEYVEIIYTTDVEKYLEESSIYLLPSRYEGMPLAYLEAISKSLPVICYDIPVMLECTNENALITKKFDYKQFAKNMEILSDNKLLRKKLSSNSKELSKKYTKENILKKWDKIINELLNKK